MLFVNILAGKMNGTLNSGATRDLARRLDTHKTKTVPGVTVNYGVTCPGYSKKPVYN